MSGIRTNAAAELLGVSPNTLRSWERRFGFPKPRRTPGGHRQYDLRELEALRRTLHETHNISSAIAIARERGEGPSSTTRLLEALERLDETAADRVMEESLTVRSVDRTIEELLLPSLETLGARPDRAPEFELAHDWASAWLQAARRVTPPPSRDETLLLLDCSTRLDMEALHVLGLVVALRRAGFEVRRFSTGIPLKRLAPALNTIRPAALVLCGGEVALEGVGQLVYHLRHNTPFAGLVLDYRDAVPVARRGSVLPLGDRPLAAATELKAYLEQHARTEREGAVAATRHAAPTPAPVRQAASAA